MSDVLAAERLHALREQFSVSSDVLVASRHMTADAEDVRGYYVKYAVLEKGPVICASPFIPRNLVEHLLRRKRDSALAIKYIPGSRISNMQGALHSFVTPLLVIKMHGDYKFAGGHSIQRFAPSSDGFQQYRLVVLSAMVHLDFEDEQVAADFFAYSLNGPLPSPFPEAVALPSAHQLTDTAFQLRYDDQLRAHARWHLLRSHRFPPSCQIISVDQGIRLLEGDLYRQQFGLFENKILKVGNSLLSMDMMQATLFHSLANELRGLERLCTKGYVFTWDPPSIFAKLVTQKLLNRLFIHATREVSQLMVLSNMRAFAFNDYEDPIALLLIRRVLHATRPDLAVMKRSDLFSSEHGTYDGRLVPRAALVIHNNSDAFGANIETEGCMSLDGVIGCYSSAAAGLLRGREDLVSTFF